MKLTRDFFERDTLSVARELLGKILVFYDKEGMITETEAYIGTEDKACHASFRRKETCAPLWGSGGFTYIYLIYGMYYMLNISTEREGFPAGVLIRTIVPIKNINDKTNGPGKLTRALGITKEHYNIDVTTSDYLYITKNLNPQSFDICTSPRIGIDYADEYKDVPWRFFVKR